MIKSFEQMQRKNIHIKTPFLSSYPRSYPHYPHDFGGVFCGYVENLKYHFYSKKRGLQNSEMQQRKMKKTTENEAFLLFPLLYFDGL